MKTFAQRLRELREDSDKNQAEVAHAVGAKQRTYSNYELGATEPKLETLVAIADYYNISLDYLLCRTDTKTGLDCNS